MGRPLIMLLVVVAFASSACVTRAPGQPGPVSEGSSSTPSTSTPQAGGAPPINSPELDLASYESRVCDLLTPVQVAQFAIRDPGTSRVGVAGPACTWNPPDTSAGTRITVTILSKVGYGWDGIYARKDDWKLFEAAGEINGYPGVHVEPTTDGTEGRCTTVVGARRALVFDARVDVYDRGSPEYRDACSVSDRVAGLVIDTLRGGR